MNRSGCSVAHVVLILLAVGITGCGGDSSGPPRAGPPAALAVVSGGTQQGQSGEPLTQPLVVKATDKDGRSVSNAVVTFAVTAGGGTLSATLDTTDNDGIASVTWTMGPLLGNARAEARVTGLVVPAVFNASVAPGPISAIERFSAAAGNSAGGFDLIDSVAVRVVDRFGHAIANAPVAFAVTGGGGSISHASRSTDDNGIARTAWRLGASGAQSLRATTAAFETTITANAVTCAESQLAIGEVVAMAPGSPACLVMSGAAQRFLLTITNTTGNAGSSSAFRFRGAGPAPVTVATASPRMAVVQPSSPAYAAAFTQQIAQARAHADILQANSALLDRQATALKARLQQLRAAGRQHIVQLVPLPNVGDVLPVRIPSFQNLCSVSLATQIGARVAYVGTHGVILEDTAAAVRGQIDGLYESVGQEFDSVMWPILTANYGSPLAMDAQLDNNARVFMVFSPRINTIQGGTVLGFVSSGDFFPTTGAPGESCAASNFGEYFYARVPTTTEGGFDGNSSTMTPDEWLRETRTVIMHEVKHIASFAEKFASPDIIPSGFFSADQWLEESSAMAAEELWGRVIFGYNAKENVDYQTSIFCEVRPNNVGCQPSKPLSMFDHFWWLGLFARDPEVKSPIGQPGDDPSVYGSGWLFLRWVLDHYATSESAFLKAITLETQRPGVQNIEAHTNRSFRELIADWGVAFALDDYPNMTPTNQKYHILSWNVRDIYMGLNADFSSQGFFLEQFPLRTRLAGFGNFLIDIGLLRGGGMSVFEVAGTQTAKQLFEFKGTAGTEFPAELRVTIARVQ